MTLCLLVVVRADAHRGGGTFENTRTIELTGTPTRIELINPHSWIIAVNRARVVRVR
jgi:hypothetical protein